MDKYDGIINKPDIEEVLYHAGFHKYIDKYMGKNGKWIYKYAKSIKNAINGGINKAKTIGPDIQKQTNSLVKTGKSKYSQARSRVMSMLPILRKRAKTTARKAKGLYYRTKSKKAELDAWSARHHTGVKNNEITSKTKVLRTGYYNKYEAHGIRPGSSGRANSYSGREGSKSVKTTKVNLNKRPRSRKKRYTTGTARVYKHK